MKTARSMLLGSIVFLENPVSRSILELVFRVSRGSIGSSILESGYLFTILVAFSN